jgi:hypothetical protein
LRGRGPYARPPWTPCGWGWDGRATGAGRVARRRRGGRLVGPSRAARGERTRARWARRSSRALRTPCGWGRDERATGGALRGRCVARRRLREMASVRRAHRVAARHSWMPCRWGQWCDDTFCYIPRYIAIPSHIRSRATRAYGRPDPGSVGGRPHASGTRIIAPRDARPCKGVLCVAQMDVRRCGGGI